MEVQDDMAGFDSVDGDLCSRDAAQRGCGHGDVGGQRLRRRQLPEQPPLLADAEVGREGRLPQDRVEILLLLGAHGGSPFGRGWFGSAPGRARHVNPLLKISCWEAGCFQPCRQAG
jgi:hypothetical protein